MKKIFSFYLLVFWCGTCLFAQNNSELLEDAKFKLIKNAVRFYSKDKKAGWSTPSDCADKTDISSLKECAKGMTGVSEKISDWEKDGITNIETLNKFKKKIENDILDGKEYRRAADMQLDFKEFENNADQIINDAKEKYGEPGTPKPPIVPPTGGTETPEPKEAKGFDWLLFVALITSIIALGSSIYAKISLEKEIQKVKGKIHLLKGNNEDLTSQRIGALEDEIKSFDTSIDELREDFTLKINRLIVAQETTTQQAPPQSQDKQVHFAKPAMQSKYTKYADMGDGFSIGELSDEPDDEKIFEIIISHNNTAKFRIVSNRSAQMLALSNPNLYFNRTCKYDSVPLSNSSITTETDGELKLQGNKWQIMSPARINFS